MRLQASHMVCPSCCRSFRNASSFPLAIYDPQLWPEMVPLSGSFSATISARKVAHDNGESEAAARASVCRLRAHLGHKHLVSPDFPLGLYGLVRAVRQPCASIWGLAQWEGIYDLASGV